MVGQTRTNVLDDFVRMAYQVNGSTDAIFEGPSALLDEGATHTAQRVNSSHSKESSQSEIMMKKNTCNWTMKFAELQLYRNLYGDCQGRPDHPTLGTWVIRQRSFYKLVQEGKRTPLTQERINALNNIGFDWKIPGYYTYSLHSTCKALPQSEITKEKDHNWYMKFIELQLYRNFYGDFHVRPDHPILGTWIIRQRSFYKLLQEGKRAPLTQERFSLLNSIGFDWNIPR